MDEHLTTFADLGHENLERICIHLDGRSLAAFQLLNLEAQRAANVETSWRYVYLVLQSRIQHKLTFTCIG